jgi:hypothetical protein
LEVRPRRFLALSRFLCQEDRIEPLMSDPERRMRVIPFGAMLPAGIIGALYWWHLHR